MCSLVFALTAWAQSDRGTITGAASDPAGAVVATASIEIRNVETGALRRGKINRNVSRGTFYLAQFGTFHLAAAQHRREVVVAMLPLINFRRHARRSHPT